MIVSVLSPKGGCGKSTATLTLATVFADNPDLDIAIVDADPRQSIARVWMDKRNGAELNAPPFAVLSDFNDATILDTLEKARDTYDLTFVDLEGVAGLMASYAAAAADARVGRRVSTLFVSRMICVGALPSRRTREQRLGLRVSTTSRSKTGQCAGVSSDASSRRQQARVAVEEPLCGTCHPSRARHSSKEATMQEFHICLALTAVSRSARCPSISAWSTQRGPGFCFGNVLLCQLVKISEYQLA